MTNEDYKIRFIERMTSQGVGLTIAESECAAWMDEFADDIADGIGTPEDNADEAISCWSA